MAVEHRQFTVTVPAGTTKASPQNTLLTIPTRQVEEIEVRIPPGPQGEVGFQILCIGQVIIPFEASEWVVTDDEILPYVLDDFPTSGAWSVNLYNTGNYAHTLQFRFALDVAPLPPTTPLVLAPASVLSSV